jgi:GcrA cell cycle regulator
MRQRQSRNPEMIIRRGDSRCASSTRPGMTQLHASDHTGIREAPNAIDELDTGAFKRVAGAPCQGHVLFRRPRRRSTRNSTPPIPATPRSAAPGDWGLPARPAPGTRPGCRRNPQPSPQKLRKRYASCSRWIVPVFECEEPVKLRCVETDPRHLPLLELEPDNCRYPHGGEEEEGEAITFCGQPCAADSSY